MNSQQSIERAFYHDGYTLGMKAAKEKHNKQILFETLHEMYTAIDNFIDSFTDFARRQNKTIDCKKGCDCCCYQPVFALDYELEYLNHFIKNNFSAADKKRIAENAQKKDNFLKKLAGDKLLNAKFACPLLEKGKCLAYPARPMACRIYLSGNVKTCITFYETPENPENYPALLELPMKLGRMMNEGFKAALKTRGIVATEYRIEEKL